MFGAILLTHETARAQLETHAPKLPAEAREAVGGGFATEAFGVPRPAGVDRVLGELDEGVLRGAQARGPREAVGSAQGSGVQLGLEPAVGHTVTQVRLTVGTATSSLFTETSAAGASRSTSTTPAAL